MRPWAALSIVAAVLAASGCGDDGGDGSGDEPTASTPATTAPAPDGSSDSPDGGCEQVEAPAPKPDGGGEAPSGPLEQKRRLKVETSCGDFEITLDPALAPETAASVLGLAESGFYDGTVFHRVVPDFVIQGGDPTGTGSGGPGYSTRDAPPSDATYVRGTVAMAKGGQEPSGAAGSQFFVVLSDAGGQALTPDYAIVGTVTEGFETVARIGALAAGDGPPTQTVILERMTVVGR